MLCARDIIYDTEIHIYGEELKMGLYHGPFLSGLYPGIAAPSAKHIKQFFPQFTSGNYWINDNGTPKQVYCDLETEGGGWMLYSSFANDNPYDSAKPAWNGNRILQPQLTTYGYTIFASYYSDGVNNIFSTYVRRPEFLGYFQSGATVGRLDVGTWKGPNNVTELLVYHGSGANGISSTVTIYTNNVLTDTVVGNTVKIAVVPFNPTGATPLFRQTEVGIAGISWIFMR